MDIPRNRENWYAGTDSQARGHFHFMLQLACTYRWESVKHVRC